MPNFLLHPERGKVLNTQRNRAEIAQLPRCEICGEHLLAVPCATCGVGCELPPGPRCLEPGEVIPLACAGHSGVCCRCAARSSAGLLEHEHRPLDVTTFADGASGLRRRVCAVCFEEQVFRGRPRDEEA